MVHHYVFMMKVLLDKELKTYTKATQYPQWIKAIRKDMGVLVDNDSWSLVPASKPDKKPIDCR